MLTNLIHMKKLLFLAAGLLCLSSCNDNKSRSNGQDVQSVTDTVQTSENIPEGIEETANDVSGAQVAPAIDESRINEIMQQQIDEEYKKGLTVTAGKKKVKNLPEGTLCVMTLPLTVTNNTSVKWDAKDYQITYSYLTEYWDNEGMESDRWLSKKVSGKPVTPNGQVSLTDKNDGWEYRGLKLKTKMSKEEFAQRFKEQTVFDETKGKFIPK